MLESSDAFLVSTQRVRLQAERLVEMWKCLRARFATREALVKSASERTHEDSSCRAISTARNVAHTLFGFQKNVRRLPLRLVMKTTPCVVDAPQGVALYAKSILFGSMAASLLISVGNVRFAFSVMPTSDKTCKSPCHSATKL